MRSISAEKLNAAAGAYNFIRQSGGAFGVNITASLIEYRTANHADWLTTTQTSSNDLTRDFLDQVRDLLQAGGLNDIAQEWGCCRLSGTNDLRAGPHIRIPGIPL